MPRPSGRLGTRTRAAVRQRRRRVRRGPAGLCRRDAGRGRRRPTPERRPVMVDVQRIVERRFRDPGAVAAAYATRRRRSLVSGKDRLLIIAADHPARGALRAGDHPEAMADRAELLDRLLVALERPGVDGVLAAPDVVEDLLLLGALDRKLVFGSMNRGGLPGAAFEVDDRFTAYDPTQHRPVPTRRRQDAVADRSPRSRLGPRPRELCTRGQRAGGQRPGGTGRTVRRATLGRSARHRPERLTRSSSPPSSRPDWARRVPTRG